MNVVTWILENITAVAAVIGLICSTVLFVQKAAKEKNWSALVQLVLADMQTAELNYSSGAARKEWVMSMLAAHAKACNYPLNQAAIEKISDMIDSLCDMSKVVNA